MPDLPSHRRYTNPSSIALLCSIFFFIWGMFTISSDPELLADKFLSAALLLFFFFCFRRLHLTWFEASIGFFALFLHHLKLYGNVYYGVPFDRIMHFVGGYAISLIFFQSLAGGQYSLSKRRITVFAILAAVGIGSFIEMMEFAGYSFLGKGEGILFYGTGDIGEWNNSAWDMMMNAAGAMIGVFTMLVLYWKAAGPQQKK